MIILHLVLGLIFIFTVAFCVITIGQLVLMVVINILGSLGSKKGTASGRTPPS